MVGKTKHHKQKNAMGKILGEGKCAEVNGDVQPGEFGAVITWSLVSMHDSAAHRQGLWPGDSSLVWVGVPRHPGYSGGYPSPSRQPGSGHESFAAWHTEFRCQKAAAELGDRVPWLCLRRFIVITIQEDSLHVQFVLQME